LFKSWENIYIEATKKRYKKYLDRLQRGKDIEKQIASIQVGQYTSRSCKRYSTKEAKVQSKIRKKGELKVGRIQVFQPKIRKNKDFEKKRYQFSRRSDIFSVLTELGKYISKTEINRVYKKKV
jgi:hypothetical protein